MYSFLNLKWDEAVERDIVCRTSTSLRVISGKGADLGDCVSPTSDCLIFYNRADNLPFLFAETIDSHNGIPTPSNVPEGWVWHVDDFGDFYMIVLESKALIDSLTSQ